MGPSATGIGNYRHMVLLMDIGAWNKKSSVNRLGLVRLAETGGFPADCIHIWKPQGSQNQLMHTISSYGYSLILYKIYATILVICHHFCSNGIGLKLKWHFLDDKLFCGPE